MIFKVLRRKWSFGMTTVSEAFGIKQSGIFGPKHCLK